eukprot:767529-Hanusia_phi.AAC.10
MGSTWVLHPTPSLSPYPHPLNCIHEMRPVVGQCMLLLLLLLVPAPLASPPLRLSGGGYLSKKTATNVLVSTTTQGSVSGAAMGRGMASWAMSQTEIRSERMLKVHDADMPAHTILDVNPNFTLQEQTIDGAPPPLPDPLPPLVQVAWALTCCFKSSNCKSLQLAIGNVRNAPINAQVAMAWALKTDERLIVLCLESMIDCLDYLIQERFQKPPDDVKHNLCKTCIGPNIFVEIHVWTPETIDVRLKVSLQTCPSGKTCLFDMKYGLPVDVRDKLVSRCGLDYVNDLFSCLCVSILSGDGKKKETSRHAGTECSGSDADACIPHRGRQDGNYKSSWP